MAFPAPRTARHPLQEDVFTLRLPGIGPLRQLGVRSDGAGDAPAWHLDTVCVEATLADGHSIKGRHEHPGLGTWWFAARRWLDSARGLEVLLDAAEGAPPPASGAGSSVLYSVTVVTSDIRCVAGRRGRAGHGRPQEIASGPWICSVCGPRFDPLPTLSNSGVPAPTPASLWRYLATPAPAGPGPSTPAPRGRPRLGAAPPTRLRCARRISAPCGGCACGQTGVVARGTWTTSRWRRAPRQAAAVSGRCTPAQQVLGTQRQRPKAERFSPVRKPPVRVLQPIGCLTHPLTAASPATPQAPPPGTSPLAAGWAAGAARPPVWSWPRRRATRVRSSGPTR